MGLSQQVSGVGGIWKVVSLAPSFSQGTSFEGAVIALRAYCAWKLPMDRLTFLVVRADSPA